MQITQADALVRGYGRARMRTSFRHSGARPLGHRKEPCEPRPGAVVRKKGTALEQESLSFPGVLLSPSTLVGGGGIDVARSARFAPTKRADTCTKDRSIFSRATENGPAFP